jgi:hypothetical protein
VNQSALFVEDLTAEEQAEARLKLLETTEFALLRALKAGGVQVAHHGGRYIALVDKCLCRDALPIDPEHPDLTRPRIRKFDMYCPLHEVSLNPRQVTDRWRKTPAKSKKFLADVFPQVPQGTDYYLAEAGEDYERRAVASDIQTAIDQVGAMPDEPLRACIIRCRSKERAVEIAEELRDSLPWAEDLKFRPDGALPADWHRGPLSPIEQRLLKQQQAGDLAAKHARRDKTIREMQRAPI